MSLKKIACRVSSTEQNPSPSHDNVIGTVLRFCFSATAAACNGCSVKYDSTSSRMSFGQRLIVKVAETGTGAQRAKTRAVSNKTQKKEKRKIIERRSRIEICKDGNMNGCINLNLNAYT